MSIVLVCGSEYTNLDFVQGLLEASGVAPAEPSKRDGLTPQEIVGSILAANRVKPESDKPIKQLKMGRAWELIASELVVSNMNSEDWGWADPNSIYLLDYWKEFDSSTRYVFVYASPKRTLTEIFRRGITDEVEIDRLMQRWQRQNAELLKFYKANKSRCIMVDIAKVETDPEEFIGELNRRGIVDSELNDDSELSVPNKDSVFDPDLFEFVVSAVLNGEVALSSLSADLDGIADLTVTKNVLVSGGKDSTESTNRKHNMMPFMDENLASGPSKQFALSILRNFLDMKNKADEQTKEIDRLERSGKELSSRNEDIISQLQAVQQELEITCEDLGSRNKEIENLRKMEQRSEAEINRLMAEINNIDHTLNEAVSERDALSNRVNNLSAENTALFEEKAYLLDQRDQLAVQNGQISEHRDQLAGELNQRTEQIGLLYGEKERLLSEVEELAGHRKGLTDQVADLSNQNQDMSQQLTSMAEDKSKMARELEELKERLEAMAIEKDQLKSESDIAKDNLASISSKLEQPDLSDSKVLALEKKLGIAAQESELLLQQLNQVQSELELYFNKYTELSKSDAPAAVNEQAVASVSESTSTHAKTDAPREIAVDLREYVEGENWYYAEHDGRWAGPEEVSTLIVKTPAPGTYDIVLNIVDAMSPEIVKGMRVYFDDQSVKLSSNGRNKGKLRSLAKLRRNDSLTFPVEMTGKVVVDNKNGGLQSIVKIELPETISPASRGESDRRKLGIRVRGVHLKRV